MPSPSRRPPKANHPAACVADREDDPFAQAVVAFVVLLGDKAGLAQQLDLAVVGPEHTQQVVPAGRCIAETKPCRHLTADTAPAQVVDGLRGIGVLAQLDGEVPGGMFEDVVQRPVVGRLFEAGLARHLEAEVCGQFLDRLGEAQAVVFHQEAQRRAVCAAAEAMVELLDRTDGERGCLFVVEGTAGVELAAGLLQWYAAADDLDDIGPREQFIDEVLGDGAGHVTSLARRICGGSAQLLLDEAADHADIGATLYLGFDDRHYPCPCRARTRRRFRRWRRQ